MKIECSILAQFPHIKHGFFEAHTDPIPSRKQVNMIAMAGQDLPLVTLKQVHGTHVISITKPLENSPEGDGLVTNVREIALGILTADCGPVLFYDPIAEVIGACHAGWRGAKAGILEATVKAMGNLGAKPSQIYATLGPTIQQQNYEVGPEFPDLIGEIYEIYFYASEKPGHHYFNLPLYIKNLLLKEELKSVSDVSIDTFANPFWSRRKLISDGKGEGKFNNLSAIAML
jgi:YfiH family protein